VNKNRARIPLINIGASGIKNIVTMVLGFVITPTIIRSVGDNNFGLYKTLIEFFSHFTILEFGIYSTLLGLLIKESATEGKQIGSIVKWGVDSYKKIAYLSLAISFFVSLWFYYRFSPSTGKGDLILSLVLCQGFFIILPFLPYKALLESYHKNYLVNWMQLLNSLIYTFGALIFSRFYPSLSGQILATVIGLYISHSLFVRFAKIDLSNVAIFNAGEASQKRLRRSYFLNEISGRVCLMLDNLVIALFLGPRFVVPFFITQKLPMLIQTQLLNIGNSTWSTLGVIYHNNDMKLFSKRMMELTKITSVFGAALLLCIYVFNHSFISLWTGEREYAGDLFTLIACLNAYFLPILALWGWSFNYSQLVEKISPVMWVQALVNIIFSLALTKYWGSLGPITGTLITYVFISTTWLSYLMKKHFQIPVIKLHLNWFLPLLVAVLFGILIDKNRSYFEVKGWFSFFIKGAILGSVYLTFTSMIFFTKTEKREFMERIRKLFKR
jgi:O-antigen/teichoic acid export membrane protein